LALWRLSTPQGKDEAMSTTKPDPIFAAIQKHRNLLKEWVRLYEGLEAAENKAKKKHGHRPCSLIAWRTYSHIGGHEIEDRREEFLRLPGIDPKKIEKEYRDAKARERAAERAQRDWDKRAGIASLRQQYERALSAEIAAGINMAKIKPRTPAGAGALVAYIRADMENDGNGPEWHLSALSTAAAALAIM
jgi:hypothetical protein